MYLRADHDILRRYLISEVNPYRSNGIPDRFLLKLSSSWICCNVVSLLSEQCSYFRCFVHFWRSAAWFELCMDRSFRLLTPTRSEGSQKMYVRQDVVTAAQKKPGPRARCRHNLRVIKNAYDALMGCPAFISGWTSETDTPPRWWRKSTRTWTKTTYTLLHTPRFPFSIIPESNSKNALFSCIMAVVSRAE